MGLISQRFRKIKKIIWRVTSIEEKESVPKIDTLSFIRNNLLQVSVYELRD